MTYVCTHCGWVGTEPEFSPVPNDPADPWCPRCPYMMIEAQIEQPPPDRDSAS